jgi:hypothetical protein
MATSSRDRVAASLFLFLLIACRGASADGIWVKGNTHAHSTLSDGNVPPEAAAKWYRDHGYDFLVLTDHNKLAPPEVFTACSDDRFLLIPGEEVTTGKGGDIYAVHLNALGVKQALAPINAATTAETLLANAEMIRAAGATVQLNHPMYFLKAAEAMSKLPDPFLIEVYNHSVGATPAGPLAGAIFERAWDAALTAGRKAWGVASDDTHNYTGGPGSPGRPGGGWVMVHVQRLAADDILKSLDAGDFYASSGVEVEEWAFADGAVRLRAKPVAGVTYTVRFIGRGGKLLASAPGPQAEYKLTDSADEAYVRARVEASDGGKAWTQPLRPPAGAP